MRLSRLMPECDQSGTRRFAAGPSTIGTNLFAAQPVLPQLQHPFAGNSGSPGLQGGLFSNEQGSYLLRT
jgi:hypothetical protein